MKYVYEAFCRLKPGMSLLALYGSLHQLKRMKIYESFCRKQKAVLFATDLASRGLDFPNVNWVVQADCPEDSAAYIHRVGRTARFQEGGQSLLLLLPSEEKAMLKHLEDAKIPISEMPINIQRLQNPVRKLEALLARDVALKESAQRAFVSYAKAVYLMKDKSVFDVKSLDTENFAHSLGLAVAPRIRFLQRSEQRKRKENEKLQFKDSDSSDNENTEEKPSLISKKKLPINVSDDDDDDDDVLTIKRKNHDIEALSDSELLEPIRTSKNKKPITKAAMVKKMIKKKIVPNKKIIFNEEGESVYDSKSKQSELAREYENEDEGGINIDKAKLVLREEDRFDKQRFREKVKEKHREEKRKLKEKLRQERDDFDEESDNEEPDLSWLPDPDKVYGKDNDIETKEQVNTKPMKQKKIKRKMGTDTGLSPKKKKRNSNAAIDDLSVNETEELALMLLKGKN